MNEQEWGYSRAWRRFAVALLWPPLRVIIKHEWHGRQHVPREGGVILAANHLSYADWPAVGLFSYGAGRFPVFLIKSSVFRIRAVGTFLRKIGQLPVERGSSDAALVLREAERAVRGGACVVFYPEGTATRDPDMWPMRAKTGVARLALTTGAPVIPIAHWGAQEILPYGSFRPRLLPRRRIRLTVGPPVDLSAFAGKPLNTETLRAATSTIMADITALLAGLRGQQPPARVYDPATAALPDAGPAGQADAGPVSRAGTEPVTGPDAEPPQAPGRTPRQRCPGAEDTPPEASEAPAGGAEGGGRTDGGESPGHGDRDTGSTPKAPLE
ncbi:MAG TPA: 1-acyl-sn-glycerol-3-phosphate acyltransferase [Streptosporangiaceae bacterium]|nr:1-acyl-sn-glycerol-3-phosphate acyltransferase [Streptosporangiaceae bacterium]